MKAPNDGHPPIPPQLKVDDQTAALLGISLRHLRKLIKEDGLPVWRAGDRVLIDPTQLQRWIESGGSGAD